MELFALLTVLLVSAVFGVVGAAMAEKKNRSTWAGFALGFFGSFVGLAILGLMEGLKKDAPVDSRETTYKLPLGPMPDIRYRLVYGPGWSARLGIRWLDLYPGTDRGRTWLREHQYLAPSAADCGDELLAEYINENAQSENHWRISTSNYEKLFSRMEEEGLQVKQDAESMQSTSG